MSQYKAAWSPGAWIGANVSVRDFSRINTLKEWPDMGIGYGYNMTDNYWGVINHDNEEGIFRISDNIETPGMKMWTWGKNSINGNVMNFSNGANFNYIELWAGVSSAFFTDASLAANQTKQWKEAYSPTVGLTGITKINNQFATHLLFDTTTNAMIYQLNAFQPNETYRIHLFLEGVSNYTLKDVDLVVDKMGLTESISMQDLSVENGNYQAHLAMYNSDGTLLFDAQKSISVTSTTTITKTGIAIKVFHNLGNSVNIVCDESSNYHYKIYNINGQLVDENSFSGLSHNIQLINSGLYIVEITGSNGAYYKGKLMVR